jgi:dihydrofolate reductase
MGRIVVSEFVSLDGVMQAPGGGESFRHGGWTFEIPRGEEGDEFKLKELEEADVQLLGRRTYEGFAAAWPKMQNMSVFAEKMNGMPKYVFSNTLTSADWKNSSILRGDFAQEVSKLKSQIDGTILVAGSAQLVQGLVEHDLIDELRLMVFPVLLGDGKRLFDRSSEKKRLTLTDSKTVGEGIAILTYQAR